ncbi:hypothetical protein SLE2022_375300 [Rubroshorea leprosula]
MTKVTHVNPHGSDASARSLCASSFKRDRPCASARPANQAEFALPDHLLTRAGPAVGRQATTLVSHRPDRPPMRPVRNTKYHPSSARSNTALTSLPTQFVNRTPRGE